MDLWSKLLDKKQDSVLLQLDQSAAYDVVSHEILILKLKILGLDENSIKLIQSYCTNRTQQVSVDGHLSEPLRTGDRSVMQGSVLSTLFYLIYVLDFPLLFHTETHNSKQDVECKEPTAITFVDDLSVTVKQQKENEIQVTLDKTLMITSDYMNSNQLSFNNDKTKLMVLSGHPDTKTKVTIKTKMMKMTLNILKM